MFVKVLIFIIFEDEPKSFELIWEVNMNSEEVHTEGLLLFCVVSTWGAVAVMCNILEKECMSYLCSASLFLIFYLCLGPICVSVLLLLVSGKKLHSLDTCHKLLQLHIFSSTNIEIIMSNIVQYSIGVPDDCK